MLRTNLQTALFALIYKITKKSPSDLITSVNAYRNAVMALTLARKEF